MHDSGKGSMSPLKKLRWGEDIEETLLEGYRRGRRGEVLAPRGGASAAGRGGEGRGRGRGTGRADRRGGGGGGLAALQEMVSSCDSFVGVPHSYFFFWAFSAALVILPVVTSLKVTL